MQRGTLQHHLQSNIKKILKPDHQRALPRAKPGLLCRTVCQSGSQQETETSPGCNYLHGGNAPGGVDTFQGTKAGWRGTQRLATGLGSPDSDKKVGCAVKFGFQKTLNNFLSYKCVSNVFNT